MKKRRYRKCILWNNRGETGGEGDEEDLLGDEEDDDAEDDDLEIDLDDDKDDNEEEKRAERDRNKAFAAMRVENKALKESVDALTNQVQSIAKPVAPAAPTRQPGLPQTDAEWDELAQKDWKKAVDLRSIQNAQNIMAKQQQAEKASSTLEEAKQKVLSLHPEINDNSSEKAKVFANILNENPDYLTLPKGPLYAMRDMEDYMENTLGYKRSEIRTAEKKGAQREASRQHRIVLNKGSGRVGAAASNKVVLGRDELEFCKFQGIDPKEYARNKQKLSKSKTEEVSA